MKAIVAIIFCMGCFNITSGQGQVLSDLQSNFSTYQKCNLQEKIYVHTDKGFYVTGEILWFKIYNADGSNNALLDISKIAYVELLDNNHSAVMQTKIALSHGMGNGSLYIPFSINTGNYQLRAYTSWMKNFGPDNFFEKQITIVNPLKASAIQAKQIASVYDVQFFPEGGHLVKGLNSKVAFKLTGADGKGLPCTGAIINQQNDTVARFKSLKFGIGSFTFKPLAPVAYKAVIKVNNNTIVKELPSVNESGYVMQAAYNSSGWKVSIQDADSTSTAGIYLIVHNNHTIKLAQGIKLVNGSAYLNIDESKLDDGISYITLFNDKQRPLCERLIFKRPVKKLRINAHADGPIYSTRKKASLTIATQNQDNKPVAANLSVSVFRADGLQNEDIDHIAGYMWLNASLKGHIESPDYYLEGSSREVNEALDNLMLSQGWTQFDWNKVLAGNTSRFKFLPEYTGPVITGRITNTTNNLPAKNVTAYLTVSGLHNQLYTAKSDSTGKLLFGLQNFYSLNEIVVQTPPQADSSYHIDIASPFSDQHATSPIPDFILNAGMKKALVENSLNMQVQNIFTANQLKQFYDPRADSTMFYGKPSKAYKLDDYTRFTTMEEVLREYVSSITVAKVQGKFTIKMYNVDKLLGKPLILLDGIPVFDADKIFKYDPLKVKRLEVVSANYLYGPAIFNGIMSFSTYKNDGVNFEINPHAVVLDYEGLQLERKFYLPVYDSEEQINNPIPDFRSTLYWNPAANTDNNGKTNLTFYTSDKPGRYIGIIEGITNNGEAGSQHFIFEVKK